MKLYSGLVYFFFLVYNINQQTDVYIECKDRPQFFVEEERGLLGCYREMLFLEQNCVT